MTGLERFLKWAADFAISCYLCLGIIGLVFGALSSPLQDGPIKFALELIGGLFILAGGVAMAIERDLARRQSKDKKDKTDV